MSKKGKKVPFIIADTMRERVPPGEYEAVCYDTSTGTSFGGRLDLYVNFRISGGEFDGIELFMVCTLPKCKLRQRFKLYDQWSLAIGRPPYKGEKFKASVFKNKKYRIIVRDTKRQYSNKKPKPESSQYSMVDTIIEAETGIPDAS